MRLGGRCHDRIYHVDRSDEFDVTHFGFFLYSSLAPVLRFRRSFVSVCFSEARVAALWSRWRAVVLLGTTGPVTSFDPWTHWIPPDLHGFYKWAMDTLALLNEFVLKVVRHRQTSRSIAGSYWIREDLASRLHKWLRPEFVLPVLIWFVSPKIPLMDLESGFLTPFSVLVRVSLLLMLGMPLPSTLKKFLATLVILTFISSLLM